MSGKILTDSRIEQIVTELELLREKVAQQETEIAQLKAKPATPANPTIPLSSRRTLLKKLALGTVAGSVTLAFAGNISDAKALVSSAANIGQYALPGATAPDSGSLPTGQVGLAGASSTNFGTPGNLDTGVYGTTASTGGNSSGVFGLASATTGSINGVFGQTKSTSSGTCGVYGWASAATGATTGVWGISISNSDNARGVYGYQTGSGSGYGVLGEVVIGDTESAGVKGISKNGKGVWGEGTDSILGVGGYFKGPNSAIQFGQSSDSLGAPTSGPHNRASLYVDGNGALFYCIIGGASGGIWRKLAGDITVGGTNYSNVGVLHLLISPERFIDTRSGLGTLIGGGSTGIMTAGTSRVYKIAGVSGQSGTASQQIPLEATAIVATIHPIPATPHVLASPGADALKIWPIGTEPVSATLMQIGGVASSTLFVTGIRNYGFTIKSYFDTHVVIDVLGYYL